MGKKRTPTENAAILDAVYEQAGLDAAEEATRRERTPEEREVLERVEARARVLIEEQRKLGFEEIRADAKAEQEPRSIPARILAMTRDAILSRLDELARAQPELAVQFRKLDELSLADLQQLLTDIGASSEDEPDR